MVNFNLKLKRVLRNRSANDWVGYYLAFHNHLLAVHNLVERQFLQVIVAVREVVKQIVLRPNSKRLEHTDVFVQSGNSPTESKISVVILVNHFLS